MKRDPEIDSGKLDDFITGNKDKDAPFNRRDECPECGGNNYNNYGDLCENDFHFKPRGTMNKTITAEDVLKHKPCSEWTEKLLRNALGEGKTLLEILDMKEITEADRIWCVTRFLPKKTNRAFAIWCARQCKPTLPEICHYIDVIEKFYNGQVTQEELSAADWAADWVAYGAAYRAARPQQIAKLKELIEL